MVANNSSGYSSLLFSPLVLDLSGNGISTQSIAAGVTFDLNATGRAVNTGWITSGEGFLVLDRNNDGVINDGSELFGSSTRLGNGEMATNGFVALRDLDSNNDGMITSLDANWSHLKVWVDTNPNASTGTFYGLDSLSITALNLGYTTSGAMDHGNVIGQVSSYQTSDGTQHEMSDVWFSQSQMTTAPSIATPILPAGDMAANVGGLVQAMGSFNATQVTKTGATTSIDLPSTTTAPSAGLNVGGIVNALSQFDINGNQIKPAPAVNSVLAASSLPGSINPIPINTGILAAEK